jgi:histidyl-tRNA synthetase
MHIDSPETRVVAANILQTLDQPFTLQQSRNQLVKQCRLSPKGVEMLELFYNLKGKDSGRIEAAIKSFSESSGSSMAGSTALHCLSLLADHLKHLGIHATIELTPLLSRNASYYKNSLIFQISLKGKRLGNFFFIQFKKNLSIYENIDTLAAGGRYDGILKDLRRPFFPKSDICAVGVQIGKD